MHIFKYLLDNRFIMESSEKIPQTLEDFMQIYIEYENKFKRKYPGDKSMTVDYIQYSIFNNNPITPFHKKYYSSKYTGKSSINPYFYLILSLIFLAIYVTFSILNWIWFEIITESILLGRIIGLIIFHSLTVLFSIITIKGSNKWNWKYFLLLFLIFWGIILSIIITVSSLSEDPEMISDNLFSIFGISWAPTFLCLFLLFKYRPYITDIGGISLFLGWIYRICETRGDINTLNSSFYRLIYELDNWLNNTIKVVISNKYDILEGFYFNVINNEKFLNNIKNDHRIQIEKVLKGLLVEKWLNTDTFSNIDKKNKCIPNLNKFNLLWLNYRLALNELPKIMNLIENLSLKKIKINYYSASIKLRKLKVKFMSIMIFVLGTIIPLIISLY